ncbi:MAG: hypothetical protein ACHQX1_00065 [Candidatus Micrarchaeales archaeon]
MDRRDNQQIEKTKETFGPGAAQEGETSKGESYFIQENGKNFRMPYKMVKQVIFKNLDQKELIDIPHVARLQYRLLLFDAVIKAKVDYHKRFIRIIYNNEGADNIKEKISRQKLIEFLASEGVHVSEAPENMEETDYDYKKELYDYAYFSPSIREAPPYGWTREEWKREKERRAKEQYRIEHPTMIDKLLGRDKKKEKRESSGLKLHP